jgi:ubiquinone/menaquinone biosynthesis C-methylase UbiE
MPESVTESAFDPKTVRAAYDTTAEAYVAAFGDDLDGLEIDRAVLDAAAERLAGRGVVLDIGCGPAQTGAYLAERGVDVVGVDVSPGMLSVARDRSPKLSLACADMRRLPVRPASCAGIVAFYSIQHLSRPDIGEVFGEFRRVLTPGGIVVLATHLGQGEIYMSEFLGHRIDPMGGTFVEEDELERWARSWSFVVDDVQYRDPLPHEYQSRRVYLTWRRA